jgi:hypothetical protein
VINLEGFVTYPYCAGCGSKLPEEQVAEHVPFWRTPVRSGVWASVVGVALLGTILASAKVLTTTAPDDMQIVLIGTTQQFVTAGEPFTVDMRIEAMGDTRLEGGTPLRKVRLRFPLKDTKRFEVLEVLPTPDDTYLSGRARYFEWKTLRQGETVSLRLRALRLNKQVLNLNIYADNGTHDDLNLNIRVRSVDQKVLRQTAASWRETSFGVGQFNSREFSPKRASNKL